MSFSTFVIRSPIFHSVMSQVLKAHPKFLPSEWKHANHVHFRIAEAERARSEQLTEECKRLIEDSEKSVRRMQQDANNRLGNCAIRAIIITLF